MPGGLFKSPSLEGYTTAVNVSQREGLGADGIMANDRAAINPKSHVLRRSSIPTIRG